MRLVLVHGISQQAKSAAVIEQEWLGALRRTLNLAVSWPASHLSSVEIPFYGDRLFALTKTKADLTMVAQGRGEEADDHFAEFAAPILLEVAKKAGANEADVQAQQSELAIPQAAGPHKVWLKAVVRVVEKVSPRKGELVLRLVEQAYSYLKRPHVAREIDDLVRPAMAGDEPMVIVAHSLGTIVTYKLLREFESKSQHRKCPLYLTLGSPLGIDAVRKSFPLPRKRPIGVSRWLNGADPEDFVALQPALDATTFGSGVENISDIENGYFNAHSIAGYLSDVRIAAAIRSAIEAG